ncbi:MAG: phosphoribosylanthranilate isomerase [candidate division NC10 bacterium]|jgi:phosphoribosylanthranilate isomerase|nr:phosphoribosylanthranilate isomerase [candidate division NC10 bacterium]MCH7895526.1 phosphoribosylanthranilate isomerase [candidate division NC10 bacterium]MCZ6551856.1 phosphoribosylanthranilate isomerase [candidate division NC10 bacterium]
MAVRVKICGITNAKDAELAAEAGADALGFVFVPGSPRCIDPDIARGIIKDLPPLITPVGVFADHPVAEVEDLMRRCGFRTVQLHGSEAPEYCRQVTGSVIKTFRVGGEQELPRLEAYRVHAYLLDTYVEGRLGGTGKTFPLEVAFCAKALGRVIIAGGLTPGNVSEIIRQVRPYAVDVSSGVEAEPGRKDPQKLRDFVACARGAE